jgi:hypothetical protein
VQKMRTAKVSVSISAVLALMLAVTRGHAGNLEPTEDAAAFGRQSPPKPRVERAISTMPLVFEPNVGQTDSRVKFMARSTGYAAFLTGPSQTVLKIRNRAANDDVVTMNLAGANPQAKGGPIEKTGGVTHYYIGNDPSKWHENVTNYAKVRYGEVYPGIDVVYQGDDGRFRYDFILEPGADPKSIRMTFDGTQTVKVDAKGGLVLGLANSDFYRCSKPVVYQEFNGKRRLVGGAYALNEKEVSFNLGDYDPALALVIDPQLTAGTYLSSEFVDAGHIGSSVINAIANGTNPSVSNSGATFVTGSTVSATFPLANAEQASYESNTDAFIASIGYNVTTVNFSTYYGGNGLDVGTGIGIDSALNSYVVGTTQSGGSFPQMISIEAGAPTPAQHAFFGKFSPKGTLLNSSVLFGNGSERGLGLAVGPNGDIHLTGSTSSTNLLTATGATTIGFQSANNSTSASTNAYYLHLAASGSGYAVTTATYIGGFGTDSGNAIAIDPVAGAFAAIVGTSNSFGGASGNFPQTVPTTTASLTLGASTSHAFAVTINASTGALTNSWYIGQTAYSEAGLAAAVDYAGNVYAGGTAAHPEIQVTGAEQAFAAPNTVTLDGTPSTANAQDGWILMITPAAAAKPTVLAATLVTGDEVKGNLGIAGSVSAVTGLAVDTLNQLYVSGASEKSTLAGGYAVLIRRRANANLSLVGGTPFLEAYQSQAGPAGVAQVTPLGDIPLGVPGTVNGVAAPAALVTNGSANGIGFDPISNTSCFGGSITQGIPIPALPTTPVNTNIIQPTAFEPDADVESTRTAGGSNPFAAAGTPAGVVGCAIYNSDTIIQVDGAASNNPSFAFTQGVAGAPAVSPASQAFTLVNFDPNFPHPTYYINGAPPSASGTITSGYMPAAAAWLNYARSGDLVTLSIDTAVTNTFALGYYSASFTVTPQQGDNAGVPQIVTVSLNITAALAPPAFFTGEVSLGSGVEYLQFPNKTVFGYYTFVAGTIFYHYDMGYEAFIPGSASDIYLYDFTSGHWWYTGSALFPYLYDFTLNSWIYYFPNTNSPGHYTANPRYFSNLTTGQIFTM